MRAILSPDVPSGGALRTGGRTAAIPEFGDIFLRRTEAFAMIFGDDELNRPRTPETGVDGRPNGRAPRVSQPGRAFRARGNFFYLNRL
jgi:hypothetical protein